MRRRCSSSAGHEALIARRPAVRPLDIDADRSRGRRLRRRHDGGDDGAELPVLALRPAGAARAAASVLQALARHRRRPGRGRAAWLGRPRARRLRKLGVDVVVMGECEEVLRCDSPTETLGEHRRHRLPRRTATRRATAAPQARRFVRPAGRSHGRTTWIAAAPRITIIASTRAAPARAPRWRPRAAAPIAARFCAKEQLPRRAIAAAACQ